MCNKVYDKRLRWPNLSIILLTRIKERHFSVRAPDRKIFLALCFFPHSFDVTVDDESCSFWLLLSSFYYFKSMCRPADVTNGLFHIADSPQNHSWRGRSSSFAISASVGCNEDRAIRLLARLNKTKTAFLKNTDNELQKVSLNGQDTCSASADDSVFRLQLF